MVDGGSLENCCTATYRGFESLFLRQNKHPILHRKVRLGVIVLIVQEYNDTTNDDLLRDVWLFCR